MRDEETGGGSPPEEDLEHEAEQTDATPEPLSSEEMAEVDPGAADAPPEPTP